MLRYVAAAAALKAFSANTLSKKLYREIGNTFGQRNRLAVDDIDIRISRGNLLVDLCRAHGAVKDGDQVLEIGTGWMHFYSLYLRLFYDIRVAALDIWDCRQFAALQAAARKLAAASEPRFSDPKARESWLVDQEKQAAWRTRLWDAENRGKVKLKPGAYTIHQIGIDDHLTHYDPKASHKQYLKYSDRVWRGFFENEVQYFNRLQTSDWLEAFVRAGFELVERIEEGTNIDSLPIDSRFRAYPKKDLECTTLTLVYRKPAGRW
jgi:hypothetical protein